MIKLPQFGSDEYQKKKNTENHNNNNRAADVAGATKRAPMSLQIGPPIL